MTMYLPNPDLHATGFEPAEFIDLPAIADEVVDETRTPDENDRRTATTDAPATPPTSSGGPPPPAPQ